MATYSGLDRKACEAMERVDLQRSRNEQEVALRDVDGHAEYGACRERENSLSLEMEHVESPVVARP